MARKVVFRPLAEADLVELDAYVAEESPDRAREFVLAIKSRIMALADFPDLGRAADDIAPGLRVLAFDRRVTIAYLVTPATVEVVRLSYRGRDFDALLGGGQGV